ncbi:alpha/beta hydrolase [Chamaesiphon minutus]|uniref:Alpha/beta superfamily hydrolase n=1 Tax=Chamaesiphon minutus (strain ATCC 27169 / PCC 6605) TaxID=1173020 RepID=K9UQD7_CHAP6|nr:alpha/beta hydrolase [Chamaesiphon minutus]AFY97020.1 alpha/beta superfamily hydrolase [Chamaesiphon minutus PCC 6605]
MKLQSRLWALSLVVVGSAAALTAHTVYSQTSFPQNSNSNVLSNRSTLQPGINRVTFQSEGETLVGNLYLPANYKTGDKLPTVIVTGAWTTVKEQMPNVYAQKLADRGFATFAFDFRYWGESGGAPRQYESPNAKVQDIRNAASFLKTLSVVDGDRLGGLGICASAGYMAQAVANDPNFKSFATVAAWLHDDNSLSTVFGRETISRRNALGLAAREKYDRTGQVDYVPAYAQTDKNAAMSGDVSYYGNKDRGVIPAWTNRFAVMSWHEWQGFNSLEIAPNVKVPTLIVHSNGSALPDNARKFYQQLGGQKQLVWAEGNHLDFYDRKPQVSAAVTALTSHFQKTL